MHAYFEYHIEQGPILEAEEKQIGVVTHCQGLWWLEFTLTGTRGAHRLDADEPCASMPASPCRASSKWCRRVAMDEPAGRRRRRRPGVLLAQLPQRAARQGRLHRRHPLARPGQARPHARQDRSRSARRSARRSASAVPIEAVGHFDPVTFDPTLVAAGAQRRREASATAT